MLKCGGDTNMSTKKYREAICKLFNFTILHILFVKRGTRQFRRTKFLPDSFDHDFEMYRKNNLLKYAAIQISYEHKEISR